METMNAIHPLWLVVAALAISSVPIVVGTLTSYLKVSIVMSMMRNAIGAGQIPGPMVVMAVSLTISLFVMGPVIEQTATEISRVGAGELVKAPTVEKIKGYATILTPWIEFLKRHAGEKEIMLLRELDRAQHNQTETELTQTIPVRILLPAFLLTELKEAFTFGFVLLLPFLAIDLIVANVLAGMGMFMVSPAMISLPLKLIIFVLSDAWLLITKGLIQSYQL